MKIVAAFVGIAMLVALTIVDAEQLDGDAAFASYRDWSFCAICRLSNSELDVGLKPYKLYKLVPIKVYWGSQNDVKEKLYTPRSSPDNGDERDARQYLILIRSPDGLLPGDAYICEIRIWAAATPAKRYLLNGESEITGEELTKTLEKICTKMRKLYPIDPVPEK
jgi:hypothetical protein